GALEGLVPRGAGGVTGARGRLLGRLLVEDDEDPGRSDGQVVDVLPRAAGPADAVPHHPAEGAQEVQRCGGSIGLRSAVAVDRVRLRPRSPFSPARRKPRQVALPKSAITGRLGARGDTPQRFHWSGPPRCRKSAPPYDEWEQALSTRGKDFPMRF